MTPLGGLANWLGGFVSLGQVGWTCYIARYIARRTSPCRALQRGGSGNRHSPGERYINVSSHRPIMDDGRENSFLCGMHRPLAVWIRCAPERGDGAGTDRSSFWCGSLLHGLHFPVLAGNIWMPPVAGSD